jgi:hypothetical protein
MKVSMIKGHVSMSKGHASKKTPTLAVMTEEMVGQGKKQITNLMLKLETPKRYISFK